MDVGKFPKPSIKIPYVEHYELDKNGEIFTFGPSQYNIKTQLNPFPSLVLHPLFVILMQKDSE